MRAGRVADAALYAEVADRAEAVLARERELEYARRTATGDETARAERSLASRALMQRLGTAALVGLSLFALLLLATGCSSMPPVTRPSAGTLEAYVGAGQPSGRGHEDVADVGPFGLVGVSGSISEPDSLTSAAGEWFLELGRASGEADAGELGLFDLDADVVRAGLGLRLRTSRALGLDWSLGLGACLTVVSGEASAGGVTRDLDESGLGAYAAATASRGPFFVRTMYVDGPAAEVDDLDVELGGLSVVGGLRWSF